MEGVIVKKSRIKGFGVFASKDFKAGDVILKEHPKMIVSKEEMKNLSEEDKNHSTPDGEGKYIIMGVPERYINHSCNPNVYAHNKKDVAIRDIKKNEEITSDYSISGIDDWKMSCKCGSKNCRKVVYGDFFKLPKDLQIKYYPYLEDWFKKKFKDRLVTK